MSKTSAIQRPRKEAVDVAVAGSGAAGIAAAVSAARHGLRTWLVDARQGPGGTGGFSGLTTLCGCYDEQRRMLLEGVAREFVESATDSRPIQMGRVWVLAYRPERFRQAAEAAIEQERTLMAQWNKKIESVTVKNGRIEEINDVSIRAAIDCTGTAEIARAAGLACMETTAQTQASAVVFPLCNVTRDVSNRAGATQVLLAAARAELPPFTLEPNLEPSCVTVKFSGPPERVEHLIEFLRNNVSGFSDCATPVTQFVASHRAGRMIRGEYVLGSEDVLHAKKFPDAVARCAWPIEQWDESGRARLRYLPEGEHYEIPARSLRAAGVSNLFMAGKTISADEDAIASARVMGCCLATGAAAGNLAAEWVKSRRDR